MELIHFFLREASLTRFFKVISMLMLILVFVVVFRLVEKVKYFNLNIRIKLINCLFLVNLMPILQLAAISIEAIEEFFISEHFSEN